MGSKLHPINVNNEKPRKKKKNANKEKVPFDNHEKPSKKNKKNKKKKYSGECRWEPRFATSAGDFAFLAFCSGDDVGPTKEEGG